MAVAPPPWLVFAQSQSHPYETLTPDRLSPGLPKATVLRAGHRKCIEGTLAARVCDRCSEQIGSPVTDKDVSVTGAKTRGQTSKGCSPWILYVKIDSELANTSCGRPFHNELASISLRRDQKIEKAANRKHTLPQDNSGGCYNRWWWR